jgi:hypothetical protein
MHRDGVKMFMLLQYTPATGTICGTKIEPWKLTHIDTHVEPVKSY